MATHCGNALRALASMVVAARLPQNRCILPKSLRPAEMSVIVKAPIIHTSAASFLSLMPGSPFYPVPPLTALMAYLLFGETLGVTALGGMAMTALAVALVNRH
jgi:hypothetical protein